MWPPCHSGLRPGIQFNGPPVIPGSDPESSGIEPCHSGLRPGIQFNASSRQTATRIVDAEIMWPPSLSWLSP